jgi:predicted RecA/RadA family phage recombinase
MNAVFVQRGETVDFIPSRTISAGEVLRFGALIGVVKIPVAAGELGALHLSGIYDVAKATGAITAGSKVYWNESTESVTAEATGNHFLGIAACHAPAAASKVRVILNFGHPNAPDDGSSDGIQWQTIN